MLAISWAILSIEARARLAERTWSMTRWWAMLMSQPLGEPLLALKVPAFCQTARKASWVISSATASSLSMYLAREKTLVEYLS